MSREVTAGQPVTLCLDKEVDVSRGCVILCNNNAQALDMFRANMLWMDSDSLLCGRSHLLKCGTKTVCATVMKIKYKVGVNSGKCISADRLLKNELGVVDVSLTEKIYFEDFEKCRGLCGFILIDRVSHMTSACRTIIYNLRRSSNVVWQDMLVSRELRSNPKGQKAVTFWLTGFSGSGKFTIANSLEVKLLSLNKH